MSLLQLRRINDKDLAKLFEWRNDADIYKWCRQFSPLHWQDHNAWYVKQAKDPKIEMFAIDVSQEIVGVCGLTDIDLVNRRAEFSLYIGRKYQGRSYSKGALDELFSWGFNYLGLNRIWGESFDGNPAIGMFKSFGMDFEGLRKDFYYRDGHFIDAHLYSIGASDFNRLHALGTQGTEKSSS